MNQLASNRPPKHPEFEHLVETYGGEIYSYLWRLFDGSAEDAEDCLQDTFLKAFQAYYRLRPDSNYRAWLYKIASNSGLTALKKKRRQTYFNYDLAEDYASSADEAVEQHITLEQIARAVEALPKKQKSALILRKYQALSYHEIATIIGGDESSARANVYQGLKKIRNMFNPDRLEIGGE